MMQKDTYPAPHIYKQTTKPAPLGILVLFSVLLLAIMSTALAIGISCYPTYGGSGVVATEVGMEMARRGHRVHFISYDVPIRLDRFLENVFFHEVEVSSYPLFEFPPYDLALASKMVEVCETHKLDILHVHYAIPHAVSAYLARQILKERAPKIVTTLHGTDITLVGNDRSYLPIIRHSIHESDAVTAVSQFLRQATYDKLNVSTNISIDVIPNFINLEDFKCPGERRTQIRGHICQGGSERPVLCHISNFRPVKRVQDVIEVFKRVRESLDATLVLVGDGPERSAIERLCHDYGLTEHVSFLGKQLSIAEILGSSDLFLLPSQTESFGLSALEAMASSVPVIASRVGGLPELIEHEKSGYLFPVGDVDSMAKACIRLLSEPDLRRNMGERARKVVEERYQMAGIIDRYESLYRKLYDKSL